MFQAPDQPAVRRELVDVAQSRSGFLFTVVPYFGERHENRTANIFDIERRVPDWNLGIMESAGRRHRVEVRVEHLHAAREIGRVDHVLSGYPPERETSICSARSCHFDHGAGASIYIRAP